MTVQRGPVLLETAVGSYMIAADGLRGCVSHENALVRPHRGQLKSEFTVFLLAFKWDHSIP